MKTHKTKKIPQSRAHLSDEVHFGVVLDGHEEEDAALEELYACRSTDAHVQEHAVQHRVGHEREHRGQEDAQPDAHRHEQRAQPLLCRGEVSKR